jgi:hypothetical protein
VYESGNAYLGGILLQNPFMNGSTCKLPRFMYVKLMESYKDSTGQRYLDPANSILTNPSKEADLLNYLVTNNIDFVKAFGIIKIFDLDVYDVPSNPNYTISGIRQDLNDFIKTLRDTGIIVGSVVGTYDNRFLYHVNLFQANVANQTNNYNSAGKINFLSYEYEFWNRLYDDGNEFLHGFDKGGYHVEGWLDYLANLDTFNIEGSYSANQWEIYAYIGRFNALITNISTTPAQQLDTIDKYRQKQYLDTNYQYYTGFGDWNSNVKSHVINWRSEARKLEQKTDALFMYYGIPHYDSTNFINTGQASLSNMPMSNVIGTDQRKNLSILGTGSGTTGYIPIFYNTYNKLSNGTVVCDSAFENLLGDWLENHPDNISQSPNPKDSNTYREAEARFLQQYDLVYDHVVTNNNGSIPASSSSDPDLDLPNLQDIEIIATSWFIYHDCYANNLFTSSSDYGEVSCQNLPFTDPIDTGSTNNTNLKEANRGGIVLYPNPNSSQTFHIDSEAHGRCKFVLYDLIGQLIMEKPIVLDGNDQQVIKVGAPPGAYIFHISNRNKLNEIGKIILK